MIYHYISLYQDISLYATYISLYHISCQDITKYKLISITNQLLYINLSQQYVGMSENGVYPQL